MTQTPTGSQAKPKPLVLKPVNPDALWMALCTALDSADRKRRESNNPPGGVSDINSHDLVHGHLLASLNILIPSLTLDHKVLHQTITHGASEALRSLIGHHGASEIRKHMQRFKKGLAQEYLLEGLIKSQHWDILELILEHDLLFQDAPNQPRSRHQPPAADPQDAILHRIADALAKGRNAASKPRGTCDARLSLLCQSGARISGLLADEIFLTIGSDPDPALAQTLILLCTTPSSTSLKPMAVAILTGLYREAVFQGQKDALTPDARALFDKAASNHGLLELHRREPDLLAVLRRDCAAAFFKTTGTSP